MNVCLNDTLSTAEWSGTCGTHSTPLHCSACCGNALYYNYNRTGYLCFAVYVVVVCWRTQWGCSSNQAKRR